MPSVASTKAQAMVPVMALVSVEVPAVVVVHQWVAPVAVVHRVAEASADSNR